MTGIVDIVSAIALLVVLLLLVYVGVRVGSFAYYRSKGEHFRSVLRELNKEEETDG